MHIDGRFDLRPGNWAKSYVQGIKASLITVESIYAVRAEVTIGVAMNNGRSSQVA